MLVLQPIELARASERAHNYMFVLDERRLIYPIGLMLKIINGIVLHRIRVRLEQERITAGLVMRA